MNLRVYISDWLKYTTMNMQVKKYQILIGYTSQGYKFLPRNFNLTNYHPDQVNETFSCTTFWFLLYPNLVWKLCCLSMLYGKSIQMIIYIYFLYINLIIKQPGSHKIFSKYFCLYKPDWLHHITLSPQWTKADYPDICSNTITTLRWYCTKQSIIICRYVCYYDIYWKVSTY